MKALHWIFWFVFNPANVLAFLFLWVGIALVGTDAPLKTSFERLSLMAIPAWLGYQIRRNR